MPRGLSRARECDGRRAASPGRDQRKEGVMPPSVGVVLPTHDRPELLRRALESVLAQDYAGDLRAVVVFDRAEPDPSLASDRVTVIANTRDPGLAGARNSGILALDTDLVAFC